ncbi:heme peroxidase [Flagelloscypha sp. PMI_526]|nr:heme peroxidase [Flagelloscypha sp. PMI_526]
MFWVLAIPLGLSRFANAGFMQVKWPYDPTLDFLEDLLWQSSSLRGFAEDCAERDSTTVAAQWVRIAYHDMSTHNVADESGGLDGSIRFETDRPENIGIGMAESLNEFAFSLTPFTSLADIIAMGVVVAYQSCGGPTIPYRYGRIDATQAGPSGVPEPHQDLQSHTDSFARQGFSLSEMISLVACGHTLGGVRKDDFPTTELDQDFGLFNGQQAYDRGIVTKFLDGSTTNPLVTSSNETMRSDLRIFSSDQNKTMQKLADSAAFDSTCVDLLERMINTVPSGVHLSKVLDPIENKIGKTRLFVSSTNETLVFSTSLRLLAPANGRQVTILWHDRNPSFCPSSGCRMISSDVRSLSGSGFELIGVLTIGYFFTVPIDPTASISKFWFEVEENGQTTIIDNGGDGYVIDQDILLFDPPRSLDNFDPDTGKFDLRITVGIKDGHSLTKLEATSFLSNIAGGPEHLPTIDNWELTLDDTHPPAVGYKFYTVKLTESHPGFWDLTGTFAHGVVIRDSFDVGEIRTIFQTTI